MPTVGACGLATCPVPTPESALLRRLRTRVLRAGTVLRRGVRTTHPDASLLVPGLGATRFAPVDGVAHAYVATTSFAALLESAFHEAAPPTPVIYSTQLAGWIEKAVNLTTDVRLFDLDDRELHRLGIDRADLVATDPLHYPCTRTWAAALAGRQVGRHETHGLVWRSRQTELHASALAHRPALAELVDEHPADVAVLWSPPAVGNVLATHPGGLGALDGATAQGYVNDLVALLGIVVE